MFEKGEYVVYGHVGICRVMGTTTMDLDGIPRDRLYYELQPEGRESGRIYTPVDNGKPVLRRIMTRDEAEALILDIPEIETLEIENDKLREEKYKECLKTCSGRELVRIIKTIHSRRSQRLKCGKKVTAVDERYMKLAEDNLYAELAMLLEIPKENVVSYISGKCAQKDA